jgi:hypothetical protein
MAEAGSWSWAGGGTGVSRRGQQCDCPTTASKDRHERGPAALGRTGSGACARRGPALSPKISGATLGLGPGGGAWHGEVPPGILGGPQPMAVAAPGTYRVSGRRRCSQWASVPADRDSPSERRQLGHEAEQRQPLLHWAPRHMHGLTRQPHPGLTCRQVQKPRPPWCGGAASRWPAVRPTRGGKLPDHEKAARLPGTAGSRVRPCGGTRWRSAPRRRRRCRRPRPAPRRPGSRGSR